MAKTIRVKSKKVRKAKLTRFPISRQTEILLASTGVVLLLLVAILMMAYYAPKIWSRSSHATRAEQAAALSRASLLASLKAQGTVAGEDRDRESLFVDAARWKTLAPNAQQDAAAAGADRFGGDRCFIMDASDGSHVGYYTRGNGYQPKKGPAPPR